VRTKSRFGHLRRGFQGWVLGLFGSLRE
jgi:hypothetical protein